MVARETPEAPAARKRRRAEQLRARGWTVVLSLDPPHNAGCSVRG